MTKLQEVFLDLKKFTLNRVGGVMGKIKILIPYSTLKGIEINFPNDVMRQKLEVVTTWLSSSGLTPPCWLSLVKALQTMGEDVSAAAIIKDKGIIS